MDVIMSKKAKSLHDRLIDDLSKIPYIKFNDRDGKDKVFHITVSSKKIQNIFPKLWDYVNKIPCEFECSFDNICIYKWEDNTWKLHKEYLLKKS